MNSQFENLFSTAVLRGSLPLPAARNAKLLKEISAFRRQDKLGRDWSRENYRHGYTSYASLSDLHWRTPQFLALKNALQPFAEKFAKHQGWSLTHHQLTMDTCWINVMPRNAYHTLHLHPHSVLSGTYYVATPPGSVALKLEDPRMPFYMNAPVRQNRDGELYHHVQPKAGNFILFESWLRHEVPPNQSRSPRISVSFNYSLMSSDD